MSKSILYVANTLSQSLLIGDVINFGTTVRRYGCNCKLSGGNVVISGTGYYSINANITLTPTSAGTISISLYDDGVAIPGAEVSATVSSGDVYSFSIPAMVRQTCGCESTITAIITGVNATVSNSAMTAEKL